MRSLLTAAIPRVLVLLGLLAAGMAGPALAQKGAPLAPGAACTGACHADLLKGKSVHAPAAGGGNCTAACHELAEPNKHVFKPLPPEGAKLCLTCHPADGFKGKVVHGPVAEGSCTGCHNPHATDEKPLLAMAVPGLCLTCHSSPLKTAKGGRTLPSTQAMLDAKDVKHHAPFAGGMCTACHSPHASKGGALLAKDFPVGFYSPYTSAAYAACLACHDAQAFEAARTLSATGFRNGNLNLHFRHVNRAKGRSCIACHSPHGSTQPALVQEAFRFGTKVLPLKFEQSASGGKCSTSCHTPVAYDRCQPVPTTMKTTPAPGRAAGADELAQACAKDQKK